MTPHFVSLKVDEEKVHVLKSIRKCKRGTKVKESDHNILETEFNCKIQDPVLKEKNEFFNLKNKDCQKIFKEYTSVSGVVNSTETFFLSLFSMSITSVDLVFFKFLSLASTCHSVTWGGGREGR